MKDKLKKFLQYLKRPTFIIPLCITWLLLESPLIVGVILYFITKNGYWLGVAGGWYALTALPLPIPVLPISIGVATAVERIIRKIREGRGQ